MNAAGTHLEVSRARGLVGPVVLIALGVLLLLSKLDIVHFHRTWPVLLIAAGIAIVLQRALEPSDKSEVNHV